MCLWISSQNMSKMQIFSYCKISVSVCRVTEHLNRLQRIDFLLRQVLLNHMSPWQPVVIQDVILYPKFSMHFPVRPAGTLWQSAVLHGTTPFFLVDAGRKLQLLMLYK